MARRKVDRMAEPNNQKHSGASSPVEDNGSDSAGKLTKRSQGRKSKPEPTGQQGASAEFLSSLDNIIKSLSDPTTNPYFVFCFKPNDRRIANQFDSKCVRNQIQTFGIAEMSQRLRNADFSIFLPFGEFLGLADAEHLFMGSEREKAGIILDEMHWPDNEARVGSTGVLLSERCWRKIAKVNDEDIPDRQTRDGGADFDNDGHDDMLTPSNRLGLSESKMRLLETPTLAYADDKDAGYFGNRDLDAKSDAGQSAFNSGDMFRNLETREEMAEKGNEKKMEEVDSVITSGTRKRWLFLVWTLTFWIPDFFIRKIGRMPRKDVRTAWREKVAINMLIWLSCAFVVFFIGM